MFVNTGTEAIEAAIKLARRWAHDTHDGAYEIITMHGGFHGRTMGALAATANDRYQEPFQPMLQGFTYVPWDDIPSLKAATTARTIAVMLEPIQGEGGVDMPSPGYLEAVQDWCREKGLLFIVDEIPDRQRPHRQALRLPARRPPARYRLCRQGPCRRRAHDRRRSSAKDWLASHIVPGDHGTTFGANPLATAAGVATMRYILDNDLPSQAAQRAD
ncbi:MAG: aminotransferase class III-fold pyridoxal phosphate-dependent enzyme [Dehalococcoidia bacterium]|nr:aminotransferase class III-fold pyridoxal phosphate-dependent enzyme [Dehalococcoidia bacterium]